MGSDTVTMTQLDQKLQSGFNMILEKLASAVAASPTPTSGHHPGPVTPAPENEPPIATGPVSARVKLVCKCGNEDDVPAGHEIVCFEANSNYAELCMILARRFKQIQSGTSDVRANLAECVWTKKHKIVQVKVDWVDSNDSNWGSTNISNSVVTEANCKEVLKMMQDRKGRDYVTVYISDI
ncbi:hypothetical protein LZ554_001224 [Drepanopeziza brunnea f. sp. 'monogermtubi']|nr:hypothetical protein LZ554_001224 [Drepanopeziza brunnea f. sp. 'monogermtubi']